MIKDNDLSSDNTPPGRSFLDATREFAGLSIRHWLGLVALSGVVLGLVLIILERDSREMEALHAASTRDLITSERRLQASLLVEQTLGVIASRHRDYEHRLQRLMMTTMRAPFLGITHLTGRDRSYISTELLRQFPDLRINPDWIDIVQLPSNLYPEWWSTELNLRLHTSNDSPHFLRGTDAGLIFAIPSQQGLGKDGEVRRPRNTASTIWTLIHIDPQMVAFLVANELRQSLHASLDKGESRYVWINEILDPTGGPGYARRLIHPLLPGTEGTLLSTEHRDSSGRQPYKTELEGVLQGSGIFFDYRFPRSRGGPEEDKTTYAALYPPFQWIVASGVYMGDINNAALTAHADIMQEKSRLERWHLLLTLGACLLLFLAIGHALFRQSRTRQRQMRQRMGRLENELEQRGEDRLINTLQMIRNERCPQREGNDLIVAEYVTAIARELGLEEAQISALERTAMLHDMGRLTLPDTLLKPMAQLQFDQQQLLRQQADIGSRVLREALNAPLEASLLSESQHYMPYRQTDSEEALLSRSASPAILALVVQVLELVKYSGLTQAEAISEIEHCAYQPFAPDILQAARRVLTRKPIPRAEPRSEISGPRQIERHADQWRDQPTGCFNRALLETLLAGLLHEGHVTVQGITLHHLQLVGTQSPLTTDRQFGPHLNACLYPLKVFHLAPGHFVVLEDETEEASNVPVLTPATQQQLRNVLRTFETDAELVTRQRLLSGDESLKDWRHHIDQLIADD